MNININEILTIGFTLFAIIDIIGSIPVLISLKQKIGHINSFKATWISGLLMIGFFYFGEPFLNLLGIDKFSFAIGGSIVIFILGLEMVLGIEFFKTDKSGKTNVLVPIAFPMLAGSGTLTTIMSLKANFQEINILIGIIINLIFVYIVLKMLNKIEHLLGVSGLIAIRKFFGVILISIAVKIFTHSIQKIFDI